MSDSTTGRSLRRPPFDDPFRSAETLISWAAPLLSREDMDISMSSVRAFCAEPARLLQRELDRIREDGDDVLELIPYWRGWYLEQRDPLPINVNPFYLFQRDSVPKVDHIEMAARLSLAAAAFCSVIDEGRLPPDEFKGEPLSMDCYYDLFRSSRGAFSGKDRVLKGDPDSLEGRSMLVMVKGRPYLVELISEDGTLRDLNDLIRVLQGLWRDGKADDLSIGFMTCADRDAAARMRGELSRDEKNRSALSSMDGALFALCLDGPCGSELIDGARHFLFDGGVNRWFEKSFQIVVTSDGRCGLNYEHSGRDGTYVGRMVRYMFKEVPSMGAGATSLSGPVEISLTRSEKLTDLLEKAGAEVKKLGRSISQRSFVFDLFGRDRIKGGGVSPDTFVQAAMLAAQKNIWEEWQSVYESVHMRRFAGGRTEGTRPLTPRSAEFVDAFVSGDADRDTLRLLLEKAGKAHVERISMCMDGRAPEGHLALLRRIWRETGDRLGLSEEPTIYSSPAWRRMTKNVVSSSTAKGDGVELAGYGPVEPGGVSVRYISSADDLRFHVGSWRDDGDLADRYVASLERALSGMERIL